LLVAVGAVAFHKIVDSGRTVQRTGVGEVIEISVIGFEDDASIQCIELVLTGRTDGSRRADGILECFALEGVDGNVKVFEALRIQGEGGKRSFPLVVFIQKLRTALLDGAKSGLRQLLMDTVNGNKGFEDGDPGLGTWSSSGEEHQASKSDCTGGHVGDWLKLHCLVLICFRLYGKNVWLDCCSCFCDCRIYNFMRC